MVRGMNTTKNSNIILHFGYAVFNDQEIREIAFLEVIEDRSHWERILISGKWLVLNDNDYATNTMPLLNSYIVYRQLA